jgi:hypothetical protein
MAAVMRALRRLAFVRFWHLADNRPHPRLSAMEGVLFFVANWLGGKMSRITQVVFVALILMSPAVAVAGPAEDANAVVDLLVSCI